MSYYVLTGHEIESGLLALIEYLTQKRNELMKKEEIQTTAIVEGCTTIRSKKQLSQIIDTTLLKCYLQVSFLSLPRPLPITVFLSLSLHFQFFYRFNFQV